MNLIKFYWYFEYFWEVSTQHPYFDVPIGCFTGYSQTMTKPILPWIFSISLRYAINCLETVTVIDIDGLM